MAVREGEITVWTIWSETAVTLRRSLGPAALYLVIFGSWGIISDMLTGSQSEEISLTETGLLLTFLLASIAGIYLLMSVMLRRAGELSRASLFGFLAYCVQGIATGLGMIAGALLLVVPGTILALRWILASSLLVGRGQGVIEAIAESWRLTKGHALKILFAAAPIAVVLVASLVATTYQMESYSLATSILSNFLANGFTVLLTALAVALLGLLAPPGHEADEVFA